MISPMSTQRGMYQSAKREDSRWGLGSTALLLGAVFGTIYVVAGAGSARIQHDHPLYRRG